MIIKPKKNSQGSINNNLDIITANKYAARNPADGLDIVTRSHFLATWLYPPPKGHGNRTG